MQTHLRKFVALAAIFVAFPLRVTGGQPYRHASKIAALVEPLIDDGFLPAVSIGVIDNGQRWTGHYGQVAIDRAIRPSDDTVYEIGSITKVVTGILLARAAVTGDLTLQTSVGEILPEVARANPDVGSSIHLLHLATHRSGLPRMPTNIRPANPLDPYADYDRRRLVEFACSIKPLSNPGEPSGYSNVGFGLLGELLAIRANMPYAELVSSRLTVPLGMAETATSTTESARLRLAPPHLADGRPGNPWNFDAMAGAGALRSTTADMLRFITAQLDPPSGHLGQAIELAWQQHSPIDGDASAMALGWHISADGSTRWHNGQTGGYHSMMLVNRKRNAGVVVLSNRATAKVDVIGETIFRLIVGTGS